MQRQIAEELHRAAARAQRARPSGAGRDERLGSRRPHHLPESARTARPARRCALPRRSPSARELLTAKRARGAGEPSAGRDRRRGAAPAAGGRDGRSRRSTRNCTSARPRPACAIACNGSRWRKSEGAPVGLEAARKRLLNTSTDSVVGSTTVAWSARCCSSASPPNASAPMRVAADGGGSLLDQLARALDYRRWHQFRVQRWQDGQWRKLSGPASSGERALGLTVPLFAAVASFYSQSGYAHAPRLVLLDEAFAGIDDSARAHCMGADPRVRPRLRHHQRTRMGLLRRVARRFHLPVAAARRHRRRVRFALDLGRPRRGPPRTTPIAASLEHDPEDWPRREHERLGR